MTAQAILDAYFLEARSRLLDVAGILDRIDASSNAQDVRDDARLKKIAQALELLKSSKTTTRAEQIQLLFSLEYDAQWPKPEPR